MRCVPYPALPLQHGENTDSNDASVSFAWSLPQNTTASSTRSDEHVPVIVSKAWEYAFVFT